MSTHADHNEYQLKQRPEPVKILPRRPTKHALAPAHAPERLDQLGLTAEAKADWSGGRWVGVRNRPRPQIWAVWLAVSILGVAAYCFLPPGSSIGADYYLALGLISVALGVAGIRRHEPRYAWAWYLFVLGQCVFMLGDVVRQIDQHLGVTSFPALSDVFYLSAYPMYMIALSKLGWSDSAWRDLTAVLDFAIVTVGLGMIYWIFIIDPIFADASLHQLGRVVALAYPCSDVLLMAAVARMATQTGRRTVSARLLMIGTILTLTADVGFSISTIQSAYAGAVLNAGWLLAYCVWGAAALHPSIGAAYHARSRGPKHHSVRPRLWLLTACTLLVPAVLFLEGRHSPGIPNAYAIGTGAVALFLLVLARMSGFINQADIQALQLENLAMRDVLTGLANRRQFEERLAAAAGGAAQVALLDLNGFKKVNDRFGHAVGDQLLVAVAERLTGCLRQGDLVARMGGDEFAVLLPGGMPAAAEILAERIVTVLQGPVRVDGVDLLVGASIGLADCTGTDDPGEVLRRADVAMYAAKTSRESHRRYSPTLDAEADDSAQLGADMRVALDLGQFYLVYQPIVELPHGRIASAEALLRWRHPKRDFASPLEFICVAEKNGIIVELGEWILRTACAQAVTWRQELGDIAPSSISVNVSARQLAEPGFAGMVAHTLAWTGLGAANLVVEVTEAGVFEGGPAVQAIHDLHELGVRIALDDFGTGHSSLGLLHAIPVDILKLDKSFIEKVTVTGRHAVIASALIQVTMGLGLTAIAEGVETAAQAEELHRLGYRFAQGYHFGRPLAQDQFVEQVRVKGASSGFAR